MNKSMKKTVMDAISPLVKRVPDGEKYRIYPILFDALVDHGLITDIKKPIKTAENIEKPIENDHIKPKYPWDNCLMDSQMKGENDSTPPREAL